MDDLELARTIATVVASCSVFVAAAAFLFGRKQARTTFEDAIAREYRDIAAAIPPDAFYGSGVVKLDDDARKAMFRYFDLSNEQLRLIEERRIRGKTARVWEAGIKALMVEPAFRDAWIELHPLLPKDFFTALNTLTSNLGIGPRESEAAT